ncbi:MAG: hypothetical protein JXA24_02595 [Proteobacteria bacterium]|nr:hypothetical protein [Pseudomonadota bacterium]
MKLINIKGMTPKQERSYRLCVAGQRIAFDREEAIEALQGQIASVEPESKVLGRGLAVPELGRIDLVAVDGEGRLLAASVCDELTPEDVALAIMRCKWATDNIDMLQHIYSRRFRAGDARAWVLARSIAPSAAAITARMGTPLEIFTMEMLDLAGDAWMVLRRHAGGVSAPAAPAAEPCVAEEGPAAGRGVVGIRSVLTREEIDDFFAPAGDGEEITNSGSVFRDL